MDPCAGLLKLGAAGLAPLLNRLGAKSWLMHAAWAWLLLPDELRERSQSTTLHGKSGAAHARAWTELRDLSWSVHVLMYETPIQ